MRCVSGTRPCGRRADGISRESRRKSKFGHRRAHLLAVDELCDEPPLVVGVLDDLEALPRLETELVRVEPLVRVRGLQGGPVHRAQQAGPFTELSRWARSQSSAGQHTSSREPFAALTTTRHPGPRCPKIKAWLHKSVGRPLACIGHTPSRLPWQSSGPGAPAVRPRPWPRCACEWRGCRALPAGPRCVSWGRGRCARCAMPGPILLEGVRVRENDWCVV